MTGQLSPATWRLGLLPLRHRFKDFHGVIQRLHRIRLDPLRNPALQLRAILFRSQEHLRARLPGAHNLLRHTRDRADLAIDIDCPGASNLRIPANEPGVILSIMPSAIIVPADEPPMFSIA